MNGREEEPAPELPAKTGPHKPWSTPTIFVVRDIADSEIKGGNIGDYTTYGTPEGS